MTPQNQNHSNDRLVAKQQFQRAGFTDNQHDFYHYVEILKGKGIHHFELHMPGCIPIKVKLAHAEDKTNNQSPRYENHLRRLSKHGEPVLFIYAGRGWQSIKLKPYLQEFRGIVGASYVVPIEELGHWLIQQIELLESH